VGVDGGILTFSGVNLSLLDELLEWSIAAATE